MVPSTTSKWEHLFDLDIYAQVLLNCLQPRFISIAWCETSALAMDILH